MNYLKHIKNTSNVNCYKLEENYRNSREIIAYCNSFIDQKMISMGISSDEVLVCDMNYNEIYDDVIKNYDVNNIVILSKDEKLIEAFRALNYEVYSIKEAKGLEFSKVLVLEEDFTQTEKYVAYTRTLDKLYIYNIR